MKKILIVGAGFSGAVVARQLAEAGVHSLVIDERDHIAGNCHTERDASTGIMVHKYGPHIFNTDNLPVWDYVRKFGEFMPYTNRVKASIGSGIYSMPINLHTINQFFGVRLSPSQAGVFLAERSRKDIGEPANFEEQALKFIGDELYQAFFYGYTKKQWGCEPTELPASILKRLPVRFDYNDNYYSTAYQGIPRNGYTEILAAILAHPLIETRVSTPYDKAMADEFAHVFFTGPIDSFYGFEFGRLSYRTVHWNRVDAVGDYQGNAVINYPGLDVPHTRVHEHKHFAPWEKHEKTAAFVEFSKETTAADSPFYPKRLEADMVTLKKYFARAGQERRVSLVGRLATYRYMDMHHVIAEALEISERWLAADATSAPYPVLPRSAGGGLV